MRKEKKEKIPMSVIAFDFEHFKHKRRAIIACILLGISILATVAFFAIETHRLNTHYHIIGNILPMIAEDRLMVEVTYEIDNITYTGITNFSPMDEDGRINLLVTPNNLTDFRRFNPQQPYIRTAAGVLFIVIFTPIFLILFLKYKFSN